VWDTPFTAADEREVRRLKARVERERVPPGEDREFHLKLGPGALADVEWTVQLLQLRTGTPAPGTMAALAALEGQGAIAAGDAEALRAAYRLCEATRDRWYLVGAAPAGVDALPTRIEDIGRLARSLGTTPAGLRADYRRVTRRCRRVVERLFYGAT
jgi:glutamate-ammonia-ligase adenylyltransferase